MGLLYLMIPNMWSLGSVQSHLSRFLSDVHIQKVESFVCLRTDGIGGVMMLIKVRLDSTNKCCFGLMKLLSSKQLSHKVNFLIYKTLRKSVQLLSVRPASG